MENHLLAGTALDHVISGLKRGGLVGDPQDALTELFGDEELVDAGARWMRRQIENSQPLVSTVVERVRVFIDTRAAPNQLLILGNQSPDDWTYKGVGTSRDPYEGFMVVREFNRAMSMDDALIWAAAQITHKIEGAGAAGRKAWFENRPRYNGEKERHFPGRDSRWSHRFGQPGYCGPSMWHDGGRMGPFGMNWYGSKMSAGHLFHFIEE